MPIIFHLRDHKVNVANFTANVATTAFPSLLTTGLLQHDDLPVYNATCVADDVRDRPGANHLFFVHTTDAASWVDIMKRPTGSLCGHVVFASSVGVNGIPVGALTDRCHACHWKAEDFTNPPPRLKLWLEQIRTLDISKIEWALLAPLPTEAIFALRLLCEAWLLNNWNPLGDYKKLELETIPGFKSYAPTTPAGIVITAPSSKTQWLTPFEGNAAELAHQMPDADSKTAVETFFTAADAKLPEFRQVVDLFLALSKALTSTGFAQ